MPEKNEVSEATKDEKAKIKEEKPKDAPEKNEVSEVSKDAKKPEKPKKEEKPAE